uniref:N-acyl-phosphatidylethanolamine-hydrolyzing phospholipase D-like n=1 Tax=Piliocolobus tephrosceles TaxID=591936 RepID=A0A8C9LJL3_9PRIM
MNNGDINAMWPKSIPYVIPLEVEKKLVNEKFKVIYIGHMSILIQTKNFNILIDPVLSNRIGLFNLFGIKRIIKPGIYFEQLPSIDFILLSNNRYDTMDLNLLKKIVRRDNSIILGGMNIRRYLFKSNFPVVYPLNWFNSINFENISFYFLPTVSNSHRYFIDKNVYLPGSFFIHDFHTNSSIFYSGHSAYSKHIQQIKSYISTVTKKDYIDFSILPMGIYKPRALYSHFHMSPKEAVISHFDLNSKMSLGVGTDVFCLGGEKYKEATTELLHTLNSYEKEKKKKLISLLYNQDKVLPFNIRKSNLCN